VVRQLQVCDFWEGEWFNRKKDGTAFYTQARITAVELQGHPYQVRVQTDITSRRAAEAANRRFTAIVESSDDAIISKDLNGIITSWNRGAEAIFGYSADEVIGKHISVLAVPQVLDEFPNILDRIRRGERIDHYETKRRRKDGKTITVSLTVSPVRNNHGEITGASKIARDITLQKSVERELLLLIEASSALLASPQSAEVLRTIVGLAQQFVSADAHAVWRRQTGETWHLSSSANLSPRFIETGFTNASSERAISEPMLFEDVRTESFLSDRKEALEAEGIRSMLVIPLSVHGRMTGTVVFYWKALHEFSASEVRIAAALGNLAAAALGTAELYDRQTESRERAEWSERRFAFLAQAGFLLSSSLDYETTLANVAKLAVPDFADWCSVDILDEKGEVQRVAVQHSDPQKIRFAYEFVQKYPPREEDATRVVLRTGKSLLAEEIPDHLLVERARDAEHLRLIRELGLTSMIAVPMMIGEESLGVISFISAESGHRYTPADLQVAEELGRRAASAIAHARLYHHVQASQERLHLAVEAAGLGIWERDLESGELTASEQCKKSIGAPSDEPLDYKDFVGRIHHEDRVLWRQANRRAIEGHGTFEVECRIWWPDASLHWVLAHGRCLYKDGRPVRIVGVTVDVTERRQLLAQEQQARQAAELLNSIGPLLLSELNPERLVQKITDVATALVGAEFGALFYSVKGDENSSPLLYSLSGTARDRFRRDQPIPHAALAGPTLRGEATIRLDDVTTDPRYWQEFPFPGILHGQLPIRSYLAVPVKSRVGKIFGALLFGHQKPRAFREEHEQIVNGIAAQAAIALDNAQLFAESKQVQEALWQSNEELRRVNEDLNQFAYSASHDLQEPLRMVAIYSQLLERRYGSKLDDDAKEYIQYTVQGAKRMEMLVRDLLAYTQAADISNEEISPVSAAAVLEKVLLNLKTSIDESKAAVSYMTLPDVQVKEVHLTQLFQNLIGNAIKYCKPDVPPRIEISCCEVDGCHQFCFADNGIGVPSEYQKQIFGIFKRLHTTDQYSGTGIGLAICQRIVERYGGRIWVESEEGQGSRFCFALPRRGFSTTEQTYI
jgi:PAS domain S-box-containing protein